MHTDRLFYQFFKQQPELLVSLARVDVSAAYQLESITLKQTEQRLDGLLTAETDSGPDIFVEFQGYPDRRIYWRVLLQLSARYLPRNQPERPFRILILFVDESHDPGPCPPAALLEEAGLLHRIQLIPELKARASDPGAWSVFMPLAVKDFEEAVAKLSTWQQAIEASDLEQEQVRLLLDLMCKVFVERFPQSTLEEVRQMIVLTPWEESVFIKELKEEVRRQTREQVLGEELARRVKMADDYRLHLLDLHQQGVLNLEQYTTSLQKLGILAGND